MAETCSAPDAVKRAYATRLAPQLVANHGKRKRYTPAEIMDAAVQVGLDIDFICWGYVLFLDQSAFDLLHQQSGEACDYVQMHTEMGRHLADAFQSSAGPSSGFDWSVFDPTNWNWPDFSDWFDFEMPDIFDGPDPT